MTAAAELLSGVVRDAADVRSRSTIDANSDICARYFENFECVDFDFDRRQLHRHMLTGEFVCRAARDLFGRNWRRRLCEPATVRLECCVHLFSRQCDVDFRRSRFAFSIVGGGGESESNGSFVRFPAAGIELREARRTADHERQNTGS